MRRWAAGDRPVPEWAADVLRNGPRTAPILGAPVAYNKLLDGLYLLRERHPRMTISAALILSETIEAKAGVAKVDLCERIAGMRDTSSLDTPLRQLEEVGLVSIDRRDGPVIVRLGPFFA